jgi:hypothetical protein
MDEHDKEHALKNYLAIILGYAELLDQATPESDSRREDVVEIHKAALAAARLLDDQGPGGR